MKLPSGFLILTAVIALALCGCGKDSSGSGSVTSSSVVPDKSAPKGWTTIQSDDKAYSISIPPGWKPLNLSKSTFEKNINKVAAKDSRVKGFKSATDKIISQNAFKLMFSHTGFSASGNLISLATQESEDAIVTANMKGLGGPGVTIKRSHSDLPGDWEVLNYTVQSKVSNKMIDHWCFIQVENGNAVVLSFGVPVDDAADHEAVEAIAKTLKISS